MSGTTVYSHENQDLAKTNFLERVTSFALFSPFKL